MGRPHAPGTRARDTRPVPCAVSPLPPDADDRAGRATRAAVDEALVAAAVLNAGLEPAGLDPALIRSGHPGPAGSRYGDLLRGGLAPLTIGLTLSMTLVAFEIIGSATAMPAVLEDIGGITFYGWALAAPLAGSLMAAPFGGRFADRFGVFVPLVVSLLLFAIGLVAASFAPSMTGVAAGRFVQGLGAGSLTTLQLAIVARCYAVDLRAKMLALLSTAFVVPGLIGPFLASAVAESIGWRWVYGGILPVLALTGVLLLPPAYRRVRHPLANQGPSTDAEGTPVAVTRWWPPLALSAGVAIAVVTLGSGDLRWVPIGVVALVAIGVGMRGTLPRGAFGPRRIPSTAAGSALLASFAYLTFEAFIPLLLRDVRGLSLIYATLPLTAAAIFWACGSWFMTRLTPAQRPTAASIGNVLEALGIAMGLALLSEAVPFWVAYPATAVASFGMGLAFTIDQTVAVEWAGPGREGAAGAAVQLANLLGGALGIGLSAIVLAWLSTDIPRAIGISFVLIIVAALGAAVVSRWLPDRRPGPKPVVEALEPRTAP